MSDTRGIDVALRPSNLIIALEHAIEIKDAVFLWGPPGCGKSEIIRDLAKRLGYRFIDIRMSQMDAIDLRGMPMIPQDRNWVPELISTVAKSMSGKNAAKKSMLAARNKRKQEEKREMIWALPEFLPKDPNEKVIIFFDEMNHALPMNLSACYQLIQERRLGEYTLPENAVCFAAGNRKGDFGSDFELPSPLADRFTHLEIKVNADDWLLWATENGGHRDVIGFIKSKEEYLHQYDLLGKSYTFATPRSWWKIHEHISTMPAETNHEVQHALLAGRIGAPIATEFMTYRESTKDLPDPVDILTGKVIDLPNKRVDLLFSVAMSLCYKLKQFDTNRENGNLSVDEFNILANNFLNFVSTNYSQREEMLIMAMKTAIVTFKILFDYDEMPYFDEFLTKHGEKISQYVRR